MMNRHCACWEPDPTYLPELEEAETLARPQVGLKPRACPFVIISRAEAGPPASALGLYLSMFCGLSIDAVGQEPGPQSKGLINASLAKV